MLGEFPRYTCHVAGDGESCLIRHDHLQWVCGFAAVGPRRAGHVDLCGVNPGSGADASTAASFIRAVLGVENGSNVVGTTVAVEVLSVEFRGLHRGREEWSRCRRRGCD